MRGGRREGKKRRMRNGGEETRGYSPGSELTRCSYCWTWYNILDLPFLFFSAHASVDSGEDRLDVGRAFDKIGGGGGE